MNKEKRLCLWRGLHQARKEKRDVWITMIGFLSIIIICILHSLSAGHYADFYPINGTFQNFNPVRRFLAGQVPFRDFQDYLGMGHLYLGSFVTYLFGGTYLSSLKAFSFLTILSFAFISLMIGFAVFKKKFTAIVFTDSILVIIVIQPLFLELLSGTAEIREALNAALSPGNSARFVRGMILPITCFIILLANAVYKKFIQNIPSRKDSRNVAVLCATGLISGFSFLWSNDYGISCWVCLVIMTFVCIFSKTRKIDLAFAGTLLEAILSVLGIYIFSWVFTGGHSDQWFSSVFGTGQYQSWYYNSNKSCYIFDVDFSYIMLVQAFVSGIYLIKIFITRADSSTLLRYGIPAFANMVSFCAVNEYKLLSGNSSREFALVVLFFTLFAELCHYVGSFHGWENISRIIVIVIAVSEISWIISSLKNEMVFFLERKKGDYIEALGGNVTSLQNDLKEASEFLKGEDFFSTYASAQEVVEDTYQPSGTDYIIHVLGDKHRGNYLNSFRTEDFKYAVTIREAYTPWEYWLQRANWFFYRELYKNWHPVYANTYELYWERNSENDKYELNGDFKVEIQEIDASVKKLVIQTDASVNGVADVFLEYACQKKNRMLSNLLFQSFVQVQNTGIELSDDDGFYQSNYLRAAGTEFIPIQIVNGYGEVTLTAIPDESVELVIYEAHCSEIYQVMSDFIEVSVLKNTETEIIASVSDLARNQIDLQNITGIVIGDTQYPISEVREDYSSMQIVIATDGAVMHDFESMLPYQNILQIVR